MLGDKTYETEFSAFQTVRMIAALAFWPTPRAGDTEQVWPLLKKATPSVEEAAEIGYAMRLNADGTSAYSWNTQTTATIKRIWTAREARLLRIVVANPPEGVPPWRVIQTLILNDMLRQLGADASELYDAV